MYFTSSIADAIRVPLHINVVCLVLLQPRHRTPHRSCSNDGIVHHSGAVPSAPSPEASNLLPRLRQSHQHHHPPHPTQWCWGRQGYAKEVVHSSHHFVTLHSCRSLRDPLVQSSCKSRNKWIVVTKLTGRKLKALLNHNFNRFSKIAIIWYSCGPNLRSQNISRAGFSQMKTAY
jgi:hypothetical protein